MIEAQLDTHKRTLEEADEAIRKKGLEQKDLEGEIEQRKERIRKYRQQQFEVKSNDDYRALDEKIKAVEKGIKDIEDRELVLMEAIEEAKAVHDEKTAVLKAEENLVGEELERFKARAANIEQELIELKTQRKELVRDLDEEWLSRYERVFKHHGDYALVPVENNACGGCHMKLPPQMAHDARRLNDMTLCMYCGRLLYYLP